MRISHNHEEKDDADLQAPAELVSALKQLAQERPFVPPTVDEVVFRAAQQHLGKVQSKRTEAGGRVSFIQFLRLIPRWKAWLAAGTTVIAIAFLVYQFFPSESRRTLGVGFRNPLDFARGGPVREGAASDRTPAPMQGGLSHERRLDILDAFILAKRLQGGPVQERRWDVNGDGVVDERDVRAIAVEAVRLDKGGRS